MKKLSVCLCLILSAIFILSSSACKDTKILSFTAFNTVIRIESHDKSISSSTKKQLESLFSELEQEFDANQNNSFIYALNSSEANQPISLSKTSKELLTLAREFYNFSEQKFNPAVYSLVKLWGFDDFPIVNFTPPSQTQIQTALEKSDFTQLVLQGNTVYKNNTDLQIDLGGLVKGYATDKALEIMTNAGHQKGYINLGNSSMALLQVELLNVSHPRATQDKSLILTVNCLNKKNTTLSTSGDYQRYYDHDGKKYSHIIDGNTGYPIDTGIASATVIGTSGAFSDAITTALCVCEHTPNDFSLSPLVSMMNKILTVYPQSDIYVVYDKAGVKQIITNKKQGENFTLLDSDYTVVNI